MSWWRRGSQGLIRARWKAGMKIIHFKDYAIEPGIESCEQVNKRFAEVWDRKYRLAFRSGM